MSSKPKRRSPRWTYPRPPLADRFWSKVEIPPHGSACWVWVGVRSKGYGAICVNGKMKQAYRVSYEMNRGPIPPGLCLDHLCRNHSCVNPWHLRAVTHRENCLAGISVSAKNHAKTHCSKGHPLSGSNVRIYKWEHNNHPTRTCRECERVRSIKRRAEKKWSTKSPGR